MPSSVFSDDDEQVFNADAARKQAQSLNISRAQEEEITDIVSPQKSDQNRSFVSVDDESVDVVHPLCAAGSSSIASV